MAAPRKTSANSVEVEIVARNIVQFELVPQTLDADGDGRVDGTDHADRRFHQSATNPLPDLIKLTLVAVNQHTANQWGNDQARWRDKTSPTYRANARTFTTHIHLPTAAPARETAQSSVAH